MKNMRPLKSQQKLYLIFLEFATRYSPSCCVKLLEDNGKPLLILIGLLEPCNRSLPHMEVVSTICDIFISTSEIEEARNFLANWDNLPEIMNITFHLMKHFKENKKPLYIFSKCCAFLWKLSHHPGVFKVRTNIGNCAHSTIKFAHIRKSPWFM